MCFSNSENVLYWSTKYFYKKLLHLFCSSSIKMFDEKYPSGKLCAGVAVEIKTFVPVSKKSHCVKYGRIRVYSDSYFSIKGQMGQGNFLKVVFHKFLNTLTQIWVRENPCSGIFYSVSFTKSCLKLHRNIVQLSGTFWSINFVKTDLRKNSCIWRIYGHPIFTKFTD